MNFSIRATIRGFVAPKHRLSVSARLWRQGLAELHRRGQERHESGAFLLGREADDRRRITHFVYYDDLLPHCLDTGIVVFDGSGYGPLWQLCRDTNLSVVADVHTHPGIARQSAADRDHPMVAKPGHIALIVPNFARSFVDLSKLGIYVYQGAHQWEEISNCHVRNFFYTGIWG